MFQKDGQREDDSGPAFLDRLRVKHDYDTGADPTAPEDALRRQLEGLKGGRLKYETYAAGQFSIAGFLLAGSPLMVWLFTGGLAILMVCAALLFAVRGVRARARVRSICDELVDVRNELDLLELATDEREKRATKLLQVNQLDLRRYYDQALSQGKQIFYVGLVCIVVGFVIVGVVLWLIQSSHLTNLSEKIVVAALGGVSGVLANFIALIYLKMFTETVTSVGKFHGRLVERDRLNLANLLAAKIDSDTTRERTLRQMAVELASGREPADEPAASAAKNGTGG